jgi:hypothetical protein
MNPNIAGTWIGDWIGGLPLIMLTVAIHVCGLAVIGERVVSALSDTVGHHRFMLKFALVMGVTSLLATALHGIEGVIWAAAYRLLDAIPDRRSAMLYSLSALTTYGHANLYLKAQWQLMGALEALDGMLLFGLTTAFLFAMIQRVWPLGAREPQR